MVPVGSVATGRGEETFVAVLLHGADAAGGPITAKLLSMLREVMAGTRTCAATEHWLRDPFASPEVFRGQEPEL